MRILSLSDAALQGLDELFEEEVKVWRRELHWDYRPAVNLIRRFVQNGALPGVAAEVRGKIIGYSYFVIDRPVGFIGNLYVLDEFAGGSAYPKILDQLFHSLQELGKVSRIECQMFPFNRELTPLFRSHGFKALRRFFLTINLEGADFAPGCQSNRPLLRRKFEIRAWEDAMCSRASQVIFDGYLDSPDSQLCRDYQSAQGCQRFLRNLIQNPACGVFSAETTQVAFDEDGTMCGILITSQIDGETGMIPQISIRRDCQSSGLGSLLLSSYLEAARSQNLKRVSLSVSEVNSRAFALYRRLGFRIEKEFHAYIWNQDCMKASAEL